MALKVFISRNNIHIRLNSERFEHIVNNHPEVKDYIWDLEEGIQNPDFIFEGKCNELLALKKQKNNKFIVVVYREDNKTKDGFIITAFITTNISYYLRKKLLWKKE